MWYLTWRLPDLVHTKNQIIEIGAVKVVNGSVRRPLFHVCKSESADSI